MRLAGAGKQVGLSEGQVLGLATALSSVGIEAEKARKAHPDYSMVSERCEGCELAEYCRNSCACRKMSTTGSVRDISEAACMEEQVHILTALEIISKENGGKRS